MGWPAIWNGGLLQLYISARVPHFKLITRLSPRSGRPGGLDVIRTCAGRDALLRDPACVHEMKGKHPGPSRICRQNRTWPSRRATPDRSGASSLDLASLAKGRDPHCAGRDALPRDPARTSNEDEKENALDPCADLQAKANMAVETNNAGSRGSASRADSIPRTTDEDD